MFRTSENLATSIFLRITSLVDQTEVQNIRVKFMKWKLKFKIISCNNLATYFNNKEGNNINKCDIKRLIDLITQKLSFSKQNLTKKNSSLFNTKNHFYRN